MNDNKSSVSKLNLNLDENAFQKVTDIDLLEAFKEKLNDHIDPFYIDRFDRNRFAATQLKQNSINSILNLGGGGSRHLEASLNAPEISVFEVDIQGDCDLQVNLDELSALPFDDASFDVVCAFDVLEHLENFHLLNEEMFRVAKDFVLISLPNSASEILFGVIQNRKLSDIDKNSGTYSKFYGLPLVPPKDRHRWWLYFQDIIRFYCYFSLKHKAKIEFWTPKLSYKKRIFKMIFGDHFYYTFFCPHLWIKISKQP